MTFESFVWQECVLTTEFIDNLQEKVVYEESEEPVTYVEDNDNPFGFCDDETNDQEVEEHLNVTPISFTETTEITYPRVCSEEYI